MMPGPAGPAGDGQPSPTALPRPRAELLTVELTILILATVMGAAFFGLGYVIGVDNVLFKALFAFYCLMIPLRLLADVLNRVTATKELRILGPINT